MKRILVILTLALITQFLYAQNMGDYVDNRDAKSYNIVKIGKQIWFAENSAFEPQSGNFWAYNDDESNVLKYGYLYDWETSKRVCPEGWRIPSRKDLVEFIDFVGGEFNAAPKLKSKYEKHNRGFGTDDYGFAALLAGKRTARKGDYKELGKVGYWWSSEAGFQPWAYYMFDRLDRIAFGATPKGQGFSVRCMKDE
jgi:uncharacterized protein (TIGR02145 family)